ncbi:MAG TPA: methyltransferase domain-containing protein [Acidisarcina sp.]|nr:methyltransferase domain-containing protein [Acidisarcina sp.]
MLKHLKAEPNLRILDIGPTSPSNINFLTGLGHSVYMADIVHEAMKPDWVKPAAEGEEGAAEQYDTEAFLAQNLEFSGRMFDVVLLWTTLDYLPEPMIAPVIERFHSCMQPGGRILALFHTKKAGAETAFCRYHLTDSDSIEMQESEHYPVQRVFTNRGIEKIFEAYSNYKFFLAKDNVYEVIITR